MGHKDAMFFKANLKGLGHQFKKKKKQLERITVSPCNSQWGQWEYEDKESFRKDMKYAGEESEWFKLQTPTSGCRGAVYILNKDVPACVLMWIWTANSPKTFFRGWWGIVSVPDLHKNNLCFRKMTGKRKTSPKYIRVLTVLFGRRNS